MLQKKTPHLAGGVGADYLWRMPEIVETYRFQADHLRVADRLPGVSAFMRIRNGAFALERAIRSHIDHFDEIVAVYNRCTDETPELLERLAAEYGPKLRVFHYVPYVYPPGSDGHYREAGDSPHSLVNYSNFALTRTRFSHATKLDDDHIAMPSLAALVADVRRGYTARNEVACFSGLNLALGPSGMVGILLREPFAGNGDHWIFPVAPKTYFTYDPRFETFRFGGMRRRFHSFTYWHLKYLKPGNGFDNYDLKENPRSRYGRKQAHYASADQSVADLAGFKNLHEPRRLSRLSWAGVPVPERDQIMADRDLHVALLPNLEMPTVLADA